MFVALGCGSLLVAWQILQPYLWWRDTQIWVSDTYGRFAADTEADRVLNRLIDYGEPERTV